MTGPSLDLDALREAKAWIEGLSDPLWPGLTESDWAGLMGRVLALVDELRKALTRLRDYGALTDEFVRMTAEAALAGSSAENKETT